MDRNSFSILKKILIALLVLQGVVQFAYGCALNSKKYGLFALIGVLLFFIVLYGIQVVVVSREHFTMVAICMVFKLVCTVIFLVLDVIRIIAVAHSFSAIVFTGFVSLLDITVLGLMVTFYVNRHRVTAGNRGQV